MAQNVDTTNNEQLPLKGVALCCTSLTQEIRTKLDNVATQMGAVHKLDLTSDVTHLVVGSITTPKYRYVAKDRPDIKVLHPDWIESVRESWMEGGEVDVAALEKQHELKPFTGLEICITGFDNLQLRNYISSTVEERGATYHGDLTKQVTHLIAAAPQGSKYTHAKQWGISIVSLKWLEDSLYRGMALDESLYDPVTPVEEQGRGAFRRQPRPRTSLGKHQRESTAQEDVGKKKLRRTASSRLESQSQDMWQDISARSVSLDNTEADQWKDEDDRPTTHVSETMSEPPTSERPHTGRGISGLHSETSETPGGLFSGLYVLIHGFEKTRASLLQRFLGPNGAHVVSTIVELEDASRNAFFKNRYLLVPHTPPNSSINLPEVPSGTVIATEWWVERCIHYKRLLDPTDDVLSRPLWDVEVDIFSNLLVSTTGFAGVDLRQVAEAVKIMGATYQETVLPSSSVLISGSASIKKEKAFYANKHHIPVVSAEWLWTCLRTKNKAPFENFRVQVPAFDPKDFPGETSTSSLTSSNMMQRKMDDPAKTKDSSAPKRLSNTRSRHATLSLSLQAAKTAPTVTMRKPQPIVHEDDDDSPSLDGELLPAATTTPVSQPLQELSPNKSPRKTSATSKDGDEDTSSRREDQFKPSSHTTSPSKPGSPPKPLNTLSRATSNAEAPPQARPESELRADLLGLLNSRSGASKTSSATGSQPQQNRKNRKLGRAPSGISNRSASAQSEHVSPALPPEISESAADGFSVSREAPAPPSTQLGYETPEAEAHRLQMSKKMGTKLQDDSGMKRLASLGTVKDSTLSGDAGVGNRVKGRHKNK